MVEFAEMKLAVPLIMTFLISGCAGVTENTEVLVATSMSTTTSLAAKSTEISTSTSITTIAPVVVTTVSPIFSTTVLPKSVTTTPTTSVIISRPKLTVSQTTNLNPNGTSVTVRGSGYDISKGVYVIVCTQAAPGPQSTCVGGVNIDGSSSSSVWINSNPPNYGIGLTTELQPEGSFSVGLVVVAKSGGLDCTAVKCGVVTRSDHLRYTDRTQDVFVPITFNTNP